MSLVSCTLSQVSIDFSCTVSEIQNTGHSRRISLRVESRSIFCAPTRKFKILANPNVLAHESSFDRFFVRHLGNSKYRPIPTYLPMSRVSIGFSCTVLEIQNSGYSRHISQ
ncbi:hypothetical protein GW17_00060674 [Ensete ventricosum]|nr:hypothetical protein GW17_00060674 [Ensete ventricosum]